MSGPDDDLEVPGWVSRGAPPAAGDDPASGVAERSTSRTDPGTPPVEAGPRPAPGAGDDRAPGVAEEPATRTGRRRAARSRRSRRRTVLVLAGMVGILFLPVLIVLGWFWYQLDPPGGSGGAVVFDVEEGWGVADIGDALQDAGVIGSSFAFQVYANVTDAGPFRAGRYELREDLGVREAARRLEGDPEFVYERLELPPGLTLAQIADRVGALPGRSRERFLEAAASGVVRSRFQPPEVTSLEGLTFPDTYFVDEGQDEIAILETLVARFDEVADRLGLAERAAAAGLSPYQVVVVGSLVQTEAKLDEDRPLISAVVRNRLAEGMLLQIDATVLYARGGGEEPISRADLEIDSPYNTYRYPGLPPTPISTVAEVSLEAAMAPADVPYRYYVLIDPSGRHAFAETLEEHEANVAEAREKGLLG
ncbi:MAG: endolytic transglycosylase MltG [Acidimicrobiia bacterium]|nr:endolytic transglycosylase MltG [Acidimicrobiia bacterium]